MSWYLNESNIKLNIAKRKIISSLLVNNYELISICFCKLYTAGANNKSWLYTGLEGGLTLVIDYRRKTARFLLFDLNTLEIVFENEFYRKFNIFYTSLSENFQCFEVAGGFIGFNVPDKYDAEKFFKAVSGLTDQTIARKAKDIKIVNILDIKNNAKKMLTVLQQKLNEEYFFKENLSYDSALEFDFNLLEKVFNSIEFDSKNKSFSVSGSDEEIRNLVMNIDGIKIKDDKDQRIADPRAYITELYKNFQNTEKIIKKREAEQSKVQKTIEKQGSNTNLKDIQKNKTSDKNIKDYTDKKQVSIDIKSIEKENKSQIAKQDTKINNVPKAPAIPSIPSIPKAPSVPSVPGIPKIPGIPSVPSVPKAPGIPSVPSVPNRAPKNALLQAIQKAGENKQAILKKPPVINDRSAPILDKKEISDDLKENNSNPTQNNSDDSNPQIEQSINNVKKVGPMDMMSELRLKMANRLKKQENPSIEKNNSNINENKNDIVNNIIIANENKVLINNSINNNIINPLNPIIKSSISTENQSEENVPKVSIKTGMAAMIEQMNKKFGANKPSNIVSSANTTEDNNALISNNESSVSNATVSSNITQKPKIDLDKFAAGFARVAQNNSTNKVNYDNSTNYQNNSNLISIQEHKSNSVIPTKNKTESNSEIETKTNQIPIKQVPILESPIISNTSQNNNQNQSVPKAPGIPSIPKVPISNNSIPKPPQIAQINNGNPNAANVDRPKPPSLNLLASAITGGAIKLKKIETVDKSGLEYLKKKNSVTNNTTSSGNSTGGKSDLFSEMRKIALKRVQK